MVSTMMLGVYRGEPVRASTRSPPPPAACSNLFPHLGLRSAAPKSGLPGGQAGGSARGQPPNNLLDEGSQPANDTMLGKVDAAPLIPAMPMVIADTPTVMEPPFRGRPRGRRAGRGRAARLAMQGPQAGRSLTGRQRITTQAAWQTRLIASDMQLLARPAASAATPARARSLHRQGPAAQRKVRGPPETSPYWCRHQTSSC